MVHCLQVALARRQCWVRAFQLGPTLGLLSYSTCVLVEAAGLVKLPRGSRTGVRTAAWPELVVTADGLRWPQPRAVLVPTYGSGRPRACLRTAPPWAWEQSYGRAGLAVPPWSRSEAPPKHATAAAFAHAGTLVLGAEGGWLYAKGEVGYEASPVVENEAGEA